VLSAPLLLIFLELRALLRRENVKHLLMELIHLRLRGPLPLMRRVELVHHVLQLRLLLRAEIEFVHLPAHEAAAMHAAPTHRGSVGITGFATIRFLLLHLRALLRRENRVDLLAQLLTLFRRRRLVLMRLAEVLRDLLDLRLLLIAQVEILETVHAAAEVALLRACGRVRRRRLLGEGRVRDDECGRER